MHKVLIQILQGKGVADSVVVRATRHGVDGPGIAPKWRARDVPY